jgi:hypothetical protein
MRITMRKLLMLLLPFVGCAPLAAAPRFASVFTGGAVLQHGVRVPVWGVAEPGERVTVTFGAALASATAGADGRVVVELAHAKELYVYNDDGTVDSPFELAGADGRWHRAGIQNVDKQGRLDGARLVLKAADVPAPQEVRYLQCAPWRSNVFNEMSLPLGVFTAIVRHEASETSRN